MLIKHILIVAVCHITTRLSIPQYSGIWKWSVSFVWNFLTFWVTVLCHTDIEECDFQCLLVKILYEMNCIILFNGSSIHVILIEYLLTLSFQVTCLWTWAWMNLFSDWMCQMISKWLKHENIYTIQNWRENKWEIPWCLRIKITAVHGTVTW